ncbi:MAG: hypothetical protein EOO14_23095, partial [Chitinophagaceae bacterium]
AKGNSKENVYIQSATLNGKPFDKNWLSHKEIIDGGTLSLQMGSKPAMNRGVADSAKPFSLSQEKPKTKAATSMGKE